MDADISTHVLWTNTENLKRGTIMIIVVIQQLPPYPALLLSCWSIWRRCSLSLSRWDCEEPWIGGSWKRGWTYFSTSLSTMNSLTLLSMSWYLAAARVMLWMMVVTWPKMEAYSREEVIIRKRQNSCKLLGINTRNMSSTMWDCVAYIIVRIQKGSNLIQVWPFRCLYQRRHCQIRWMSCRSYRSRGRWCTLWRWRDPQPPDNEDSQCLV